MRFNKEYLQVGDKRPYHETTNPMEIRRSYHLALQIKSEGHTPGAISKHKIMNDPDKVSQNSENSVRPNKEQHRQDPEFTLRASPDDTLLSYVQAKNKPLPNRISVPMRQGIIELVQIEDILYVESSTQICYVHLRDDTRLTAFKGLPYFKGLLSEDQNFFPINDKILINLNFLHRYNHKELTITLTTKKTLYASRRGGQRLRKLLQDKKIY